MPLPTLISARIWCPKGLGLVYRKRRPLGIVLEVQPEGSYFWDGPRMTPYHNKLFCWEVHTIHLLKQRTYTSVVSLW